jgi:20S proteasome alpha/beta subunit
MTLILGAFCSEGLLLTADREESSEYAKRSVQKLFEIHPPSGAWRMVVGGAGDSAFSDFVMGAIARAALQSSDTFTANHEQVLSDTLREVYRDYMYCVPKNVREARGIELLIGLNTQDGSLVRLYKTNDEIVNIVLDYACCGIGRDIADYFLDRLYEERLTERQLIAFAAFVVREAKDSVEAVGKETECFFLPNAQAMRKGAALRHYYQHGAITDALLPRLSQIINHFWRDPESLSDEIKRELLLESGIERL